jgi:hypothetical protein
MSTISFLALIKRAVLAFDRSGTGEAASSLAQGLLSGYQANKNLSREVRSCAEGIMILALISEFAQVRALVFKKRKAF